MAVIETERLRLEPVKLSDAAFIYELQNSPKWLRYIGDRNISSVAVAEKYIADKMLSHYKEHAYGNCVVYNKETAAPMGTCGLFNRPGLAVVDIGFAFLPQYEGKGFGSEAALALMDHAQNNLKLHKVSAIVLPENKASVRLIEKLGLEFVKPVQLPGDTAWLDYYEITLNE